ncbi:diadenylate cyclase [Oceanirhabdus sp. W0125-5]|uniref:diadenylate cyclase n=1 Tax=Oceanirhabdus sp. W0125-5 TaxID=2999116 RepID=UPI0022F2CAE2|nr:diadenylate cyclase [Oceanirhabdus sp. W0125-5]WBW95260.1 diadenylate cyclase [Oceanirhabdus sp. W0125-5]
MELEREFAQRYIIMPPVKENYDNWLVSFINQVIDILFDYWRESLYLNLKYSTTSVEMSDDEVIRLATQDLTVGRGLPHLSIFNKISSQNYEGRACRGKITFVDYSIKKEDYIEFKNKISISEENIRLIRKLLEMTEGEYTLYAYKDCIYGLGAIKGILDVQSIEFFGYAKWRMLFNYDEILRYHNGEVLLPKTDFSKEYNKRIIENFFLRSKGEKNLSILYSLIEEATKQKHGTMILISAEAEYEANRLSKNGRGTKINPLELNKEMILNISSIDGALLLDLTGKCHAIGVLVDGVSNGRGKPARGARYNSGNDYVRWRNKKSNKCIAVIISEDKSVDIIN